MTGFKRYSLSTSVAARKVIDGSLLLEEIAKLPYPQAKKQLLTCHGVGHKVADCVLLFSLDKLEAFPIDTHIGRALAESYCPGQNPPKTHELARWATKFQMYFGQYAGYAGQFLFHDMRERSAASHR